MKEITLARLKNTDFVDIYRKLITNKELTEDEKYKLLQSAIVFFNSSNNYIRDLGYRIIVIYCNKYKFYRPLYEIAINK